MDAASDEELARLLQFQFDSETASEIADIEPVSSNNRRSSGTKPIGIVDERWELIDPNPDVRALFLQFNDQFFWGRLAGVEVRWSPRMTLCAGLCCYEGYGGLCSIRLSQPLLKLRPRKDLVETLLHEMIHAYLFVTQNNKDHDGHGPEFCKHMNRINSATGTNISIYHTFHDEVDSYRQHWWRCDGPCRQRKPYFGYVKRSMNRAPSARDPWWGEHQRSCGGTYTKIKEPEGYGQKKGGKKKGDEGEGSKESNDTKDKPGKLGADIRNFIPFSGKGQTLGRPATSTSLLSSNTSPLSGISTSSGSTTSSTISDRHGGQAKERKRSSDSKDISSFFTKKDSNQSTSTANSSTNNYAPPHLPNSSSSGSGFQKKPRFTPVVATASGRVVDTKEFDLAEEKFRNSGQTTKMKDSDSAIPRNTGRFTPVIAPVGRKGSIHETKIPGESSSSSKGAKGVDTVGNCRDKSNNKDLPSFSKTVSTRRADGERTSSEINKKKRARLVDLQAIFDSDSDEEEGMNRSSKCPRYSRDNSGEEDGAILVDDVSRRTSASSNKENSPALHQNLLNKDRGDVYIHDDSDNDDVVARPTSNEINTGIWKDLSHLSSANSGSQVDGNRRFGRVTPPLWGKSKRKTNHGHDVGQTPPQSSFCEHPWQTAARESGRKAISGRAGEVINLLAEDDDGGLVEQVGPKTVPCPVCNLQIEEKKINSHLDTCLTFNCNALFSP